MMKRVILLILLFSALLSGCKTTIQKEETAVAEPTDELIIYIPPYSDYWLNPIISRFEFLYGIEVTTVDYSKEDYMVYSDNVTAELLSGEGPDVIFPSFMFADMQKMMANEIFMDIQPYFSQDKEFVEDDYLIKSFESGKFGDKQYIVPLSFTFPAYISSTTKLNEVGFNWNNAQNIASFLSLISDILPIAQNNNSFSQIMSSKNWYSFFISQSGIDFIDYYENTVCNDEDAIRMFFESYKRYFSVDYSEDGIIYSDNIGYKHILDGEFYFNDQTDMSTLIETASILKTYGGYELSAMKGMDGTVYAELQNTVAVKANSKNKLNAYNFIKLLLSEDFQGENVVGFPVNKNALINMAYKTQSEYMHKENVPGFNATQLTDEEIQNIVETLCSADNYSISNPNVILMVFETMLPYFQDKQDYDTCFNDLKSKLSLYLYE